MNKKKKHDRMAEQEKTRILDPDKIVQKQKKQWRTGILITCGMLLTILLLCAGTVLLLQTIGKNHLISNATSIRPELVTAQLSEPVSEEKKEAWQEGWVKYQGKIYAYNEDIMTFLIMGIDKNSEAVEVAEGTNGGQADALFLAVLNPHTREVSVIGVNRNTMTDIEVYDLNGNYVKTVTAQLATQHGFGNGVEKSCEYQVKAVTKLFYNLPIHGYAAVNMSAIATLNDAVGGVEVTVLEDLTRQDQTLVKGEKVHLEGKSAFWYVKYRDINLFGSADARLERQKQYLTEFIKTAKTAAKKDFSIVPTLYQAVEPMMTTDITADETVYLAGQALDYRVGENSFYTLKGETVQGEKFEEFYPDELALYELILKIFYEEVEQQEEGEVHENR